MKKKKKRRYQHKKTAHALRQCSGRRLLADSAVEGRVEGREADHSASSWSNSSFPVTFTFEPNLLTILEWMKVIVAPLSGKIRMEHPFLPDLDTNALALIQGVSLTIWLHFTVTEEDMTKPETCPFSLEITLFVFQTY